MTEERKKIIIRYHYIVVCILMGLLVLGGVFVGSIQTDLNTAEKHFSDTISYIKEQCTGYDNLNLASETKSLMRVMENVQHLCSDIERERELDDSFVLDDAGGTISAQLHHHRCAAAHAGGQSGVQRFDGWPDG